MVSSRTRTRAPEPSLTFSFLSRPAVGYVDKVTNYIYIKDRIKDMVG